MDAAQSPTCKFLSIVGPKHFPYKLENATWIFRTCDILKQESSNKFGLIAWMDETLEINGNVQNVFSGKIVKTQ